MTDGAPPGWYKGRSVRSSEETSVSRALPLTPLRRTDNYIRQSNRASLTPAQRRRIRHRANRAKADNVNLARIEAILGVPLDSLRKGR